MTSGPSEQEDMGKEYHLFSTRESEFVPGKADATDGVNVTNKRAEEQKESGVRLPTFLKSRKPVSKPGVVQKTPGGDPPRKTPVWSGVWWTPLVDRERGPGPGTGIGDRVASPVEFIDYTVETANIAWSRPPTSFAPR